MLQYLDYLDQNCICFIIIVTQNFTTVPSDKHVLFGSATLFNCVSHGAPKPIIEWRIKLNKLERNFTVDRSYKHQYEVLQNGSLLVKSAMIDDEGEYYCVSNSPGLIRDASADLTVFGRFVFCYDVQIGICQWNLF